MSDEPTDASDDEAIAERRGKLKALRAKGSAFPNDHYRQNLCGDLVEQYEDAERDSLDMNPVVVKLAGRLMGKRVMGKASFATIQDMSGQIAVYITDSYPGKAPHNAFKQWDIGDIIGVDGVLFKTQQDNLTVRARGLRLLTKSLRPLPQGFRAATQDVANGARYVDLIMNEGTRLRFVQRSRIIQALRHFLSGRHFLEVETPVLQPKRGGAVARTFATHHNALDIDLYLRVAPRLYLKRLVVGGFEKVFEVSRNFKSGEMTRHHAAEFTMLALCVAYVEHGYLMWFIENMLRQVAQSAVGTARLTYQGHTIDLEKDYERLTIPQAITRYHADCTDELLHNRDALLRKLNEVGATHKPTDDLERLQLSLFEHTTERLLIQPTFIVEYPTEVSPLARRKDAHPQTSERFQLYMGGHEVASGYAELNDPEEQAARLEQGPAGDGAAMDYDADYIRALEYGLPPTASAGIGVDRLVMILTDSTSIRDVVLFPQRPPERPA